MKINDPFVNEWNLLPSSIFFFCLIFIIFEIHSHTYNKIIDHVFIAPFSFVFALTLKFTMSEYSYLKLLIINSC